MLQRFSCSQVDLPAPVLLAHRQLHDTPQLRLRIFLGCALLSCCMLQKQRCQPVMSPDRDARFARTLLAGSRQVQSGSIEPYLH